MVGRQNELKKLSDGFHSTKNNLVVIYGRRRIGKSYLIRFFCKEKRAFIFEGLEGGSTQKQINSFLHEMRSQLKNFNFPDVPFKTWSQVFDLLTLYLQVHKEKVILVFDEFQWMAAQRSGVVSLIKFYFDQKWNDNQVMIILCGSISSFMVKKVIRSKALYGRVNLELKIEEFEPQFAYELFAKKLSEYEVLRYLVVLGGVPKYLAEIKKQESFSKNIDRLCFQKDGFLFNEFEKIFYSQFKEAKTYQAIVQFLSKGPASLQQISEKINMQSGGGLKEYLSNLGLAGFVREYAPVGREKSKIIRYRIHDQFLAFYFKHMKGNRHFLEEKLVTGYFQNQIEPQLYSWLGIAFENYCVAHAHLIAKALNIKNEVIDSGPLIYKDKPGVQIDLAFIRKKSILTICEIKYKESEVGTEVISEVKKKLKVLSYKFPKKIRIEKVLIAPNGVQKSLLQADFFNQIITIKDLFK